MPNFLSLRQKIEFVYFFLQLGLAELTITSLSSIKNIISNTALELTTYASILEDACRR